MAGGAQVGSTAQLQLLSIRGVQGHKSGRCRGSLCGVRDQRSWSWRGHDLQGQQQQLGYRCSWQRWRRPQVSVVVRAVDRDTDGRKEDSVDGWDPSFEIEVPSDQRPVGSVTQFCIHPVRSDALGSSFNW